LTPAGALPERSPKQGPIQRERSARLHLAEQRLARPLIRVPHRNTSGVPGSRLHLIPGNNLIGEIEALKESELLAEGELPEK
jgi:hypothetical protein